MNWVRENKFLTGFIAVLVIGVGVLGYLVYAAWGSFSDVSDAYTQEADALHQLQSRLPYPDQANLAKYRGEEDNLIATTGTLASSLSQMVLPVREMSPSAFQDRLRDVLSTIAAKAGRTGVKIPAKFALDFVQYQTQPPPEGAAGPLGRQLEALNIAVNILLDEHVDSIEGLERTRLPQESGGHAGGGAGAGHRGGGLGGESPEEVSLVEKYPFQVKFTASQPAFQKVLNDFAASSRQFFITRALMVDNTQPKPVSKGGPDTGAPPPPPAAAAGSASEGTSYLTFIVGTEKLNISMQIDMAVFNPPEKPARRGGAPSHQGS